VRAKAFDGFDFFPGGGGNRQAAGLDRFAIQQDGAGAAGTFATTILGAGESQVFAQDFEERARGIGRERLALAVDGELNFGTHGQDYSERFTLGEVTK
jgi:hypothetical protein